MTDFELEAIKAIYTLDMLCAFLFGIFVHWLFVVVRDRYDDTDEILAEVHELNQKLNSFVVTRHRPDATRQVGGIA